MALNQIDLSARIAELGLLRYTPAGLPALNLVLEHESEQVESGGSRQVKLTIRAVAFGTLAERLVRMQLGRNCGFSGFLSSARTSKSLVFHIQEFNLI